MSKTTMKVMIMKGMVTAAKQRVAEKMMVVTKMMTVMGRKMTVKT